MYRRIDHVAFHVADLGRSIQFYEKHFGFKQYFQHEATGGMQIAYLKLGDTILELTHKAGDAPTGFHFCLEAENLSQAVAELKKPEWKWYGRRTILRQGSRASKAGVGSSSVVPTASK